MDVGTNNFSKVLPVILKEIKSSTFISIDLEFTGLLTDNAFKRSLLDSGDSLYEKESKNLENISVCQIGLSIFKGLRDVNNYYVSTYNIYIRPRDLLSIDDKILWQSSSLDFLRMCNFNYSKWIDEGVPCLREDQEREVRKLFSQILSGDLNGYSLPKDVIDEHKNIKRWAQENETGCKTEVKLFNSSCVLLFIITIISAKLNVEASYVGDYKVSLTLVDSFDEKNLKNEALKCLEVLIDQSKGFVKIFNELTKIKVPIVFHNGLLDLLLIYKQFYKRLPKNFSVFCQDIHEMFPLIYDTKRLAYKLGIKTKEIRSGNENENANENHFFGTSLMKVKENLDGYTHVLFRPQVIHSSCTPKYANGIEYLHEAGYDSFITGYCFLHLSHINVMLQYESAKYHRPLSPRELKHGMKEWCNEIPIQRAGVHFVTLDGRSANNLNTKSWFVVEPRNPFRSISPEIVASSLSSIGTVDIVQRNKRSVLIAAHKHSVMKDILRVLRDDNNFSVTRYKAIRHSKFTKSLAWSCALLSTGLSTWCLVKGYQIVAH